MTRPRIAITTGEPAGIGPEICAIALGDARHADITLIGDERLLAARARAAGVP
ncbi:MAG: 4-hydroxythreonine-4-phosphate dehydrogenase, partial [Burkholderiaceae bacterium]